MSSPRPTRVPGSRTTSLSDVASLVGGALHGSDVAVTGVSLSSEDILAGDLYAALPGANTHGAAYAARALAAGAVAVLTDEGGERLLSDVGVTEVELPRLVVDSPRAVVGATARLVYGTGELTLQLYGVTGTNGKTTTAYLINSALEALGHSTGLIGTVETRIRDERIRSVRTTPEATVLHALLAVMEQREVDSCVMEVSSHALAQHRVDGVVYDVALFTNLSQDHLDFHPTMRDYFEAKASLFTPARARRGVVCVDDEWGRELAGSASVPVTTLSSTPEVDADWRVLPGGGHEGAGSADPAAFTLTDGATTLRLRSALPGDFNRVNTAMAALAIMAAGTDPASAERALLVDPHVPGRMERVAVEAPEELGLPLVVVDYAHTPDAVAAALRALRPDTRGALVVVLGAGGDRDRGKRAAMGRAAADNADLVFVTDDNPRSEDPAAIRAAVLAGAAEAAGQAQLHDVAGRHTAIAQAVAAAHLAGPGSTVAVVGKGHESGQEIAGTVHPFDDRDEAREALRQIADQPPHRPGLGRGDA